MLIVYVDDIILTRDEVREINRLKTSISSTFVIKDLGPFRYFLSMEVLGQKKGLLSPGESIFLISLRRLE